jgi:WD40 repeat protein
MNPSSRGSGDVITESDSTVNQEFVSTGSHSPLCRAERVHSLVNNLQAELSSLLTENAVLRAKIQFYESNTSLRYDESKAILEPASIAHSLTGSGPERSPGTTAGAATANILEQGDGISSPNTPSLLPWRSKQMNVTSSSLANAVLSAHIDGLFDVSSCAWDPQLICSSAADGRVFVWNIGLAQPVVLYSGHHGAVNSARFHPTRPLILTASGDRSVHVFRVPTIPGSIADAKHALPRASYHNFALRPNEPTPVRYDYTSSPKSTSRELFTGIAAHSALAMGLPGIHSPAATGAIHASSSAHVLLHDDSNGTLPALSLPPAVTTGSDQHAELSDDEPATLDALEAQSARRAAAAAAAAAGVAATGRDARTAQVTVPATNTTISYSPPSVPMSSTVSVAVSSADYAAGANRAVYITQPQSAIRSHSRPLMCADWMHDGGHAVSGGWDHHIHMYDSGKGSGGMQLLSSFKAHSKPITHIACHPSATSVVSASEDGLVKLWDLRKDNSSANGATVFKEHSNVVRSAVLSPSGDFIASTGDDKDLLLWDSRRSDKPLLTIDLPSGGNRLAFAPSSSSISVPLDNGRVNSYSLEGKLLFRAPDTSVPGASSMLHACCWTRDEMWLVAAAWDGALLCWRHDR